MSILIDSGETVVQNVKDFYDDFFRPIDKIWGKYEGHDAVAAQRLKCENNGTFRLEHLQVSGFGIALTITKEKSASGGDCITTYKIKMEPISEGKVEQYIAEHQPIENQVGPTLLLKNQHLISNPALQTNAFCCRIGKYEDGRYVLFLHCNPLDPGCSEVNNPVRIPSE